ncbi:hypothetical protein ATANTOWER_023134 [Ataeniobius toweri]|uniref:Uncharacterized protein n=1 Tax=Ataeniobius toweri TaxID=208326 RepID=A0ABU7B1R8_9TELE|nr:hypothetical protein [Ataeniobius toweri]
MKASDLLSIHICEERDVTRQSDQSSGSLSEFQPPRCHLTQGYHGTPFRSQQPSLLPVPPPPVPPLHFHQASGPGTSICP